MHSHVAKRPVVTGSCVCVGKQPRLVVMLLKLFHGVLLQLLQTGWEDIHSTDWKTASCHPVAETDFWLLSHFSQTLWRTDKSGSHVEPCQSNWGHSAGPASSHTHTRLCVRSPGSWALRHRCCPGAVQWLRGHQQHSAGKGEDTKSNGDTLEHLWRYWLCACGSMSQADTTGTSTIK